MIHVHTFCAFNINSKGLNKGLKLSFLECLQDGGGGGTGRVWLDSSIAEALISFSARLSQASRKSEATA